MIADEYDEYERVSFAVIDVLVTVGGSFNSLKALGFIVTAVFSYRLFYASLIRHLFHFDTSKAEWEKEFKKAEKKIRKNQKKQDKEDNKEAMDYMHRRDNMSKRPSEYTEMDKLKYKIFEYSSFLV